MNSAFSATLIVCKDLSVDYVYVGQTTNLFNRRSTHKSRCNNEKDKKYHYPVYQKIRENGGWENFVVVEIEKFPCKDYNEAASRERFFIEQFSLQNNTLNKVIPTRTDKEWRNDNIDRLLEKEKIYRDNTKQIRSDKMKIYYQENKDSKLEKRRIYYNNHKEIESEKAKIKVKCECGSEVQKGDIAKHRRTKKHIEIMGNIEYKIERVTCECGSEVAKKQLTCHKKTKKHINLMENLPKTE